MPYVIGTNPKFYPYFKDALGAIDRTHFSVRPPAGDKVQYQDCDGDLSQNVIAACDWDMIFLFLLIGWEGSASDGFLYQEAMKAGFLVPEGKYYLADAGFANCDSLIVPYCNTRYHLREWQAAGLQYVLLTCLWCLSFMSM